MNVLRTLTRHAVRLNGVDAYYAAPSARPLFRGFESHARCSSIDVLNALSEQDVLRLHARLGGLVTGAVERYAALASMTETSALAADLAREMRDLDRVARNARAFTDFEAEIRDVRALAAEAGAGTELALLAEEEESVLRARLHSAAVELVSALLDRYGDSEAAAELSESRRQSAIVEIRAGAGGDEASLFVNDLLGMYDKYASRRKWQSRFLSLSETSVGGIREVIMRFEGGGVYQRLALEAGVHRVQRVPETESGGRVHTSTATVAVLKDDCSAHRMTKLKESDIRMDVYRASGAGGQHVNKTESAVRLTHIPTGLVAQSQEDRSQHRNRAIAMEALIARVAAKAAADAAAAKSAERHAQLGVSQGERSDRIRTYNFPQRRVTDHRIVMGEDIKELLPSASSELGEKNADLDAVLSGSQELDRIMDAVHWQSQLDRIRLLVAAAEASERKSKGRRDAVAG